MRSTLALVLTLLFPGLVWAADPQFAPQEVLVRYVEAAPPQAITGIEARYGLTLVGEIEHLRVQHYSVSAAMAVPDLCDQRLTRGPTSLINSANTIQEPLRIILKCNGAMIFTKYLGNGGVNGLIRLLKKSAQHLAILIVNPLPSNAFKMMPMPRLIGRCHAFECGFKGLT